MHPHTPLERRRAFPIRKQGFSLVEILIVLGIVSFVLIPLVATLLLAHQNNKTAEETTELVLIMQSCNSLLRGNSTAALRTKLTSAPLTNYFADGGRYLGTNPSSTAFYRCVVSLNTNVPQSNQRIGAIVKIQYPAPAYALSFSYPIGVFNYGAKLP